MSLTNIDSFNRNECDKIDPNCINAFVDFHLDPDNPTGICIDTSWGGECLDLKNIVKEAETCTALYLSPADDPNCLVYEGECENFCITGDELSRIISMTKLKDVDQETAPRNGDVYIYNNGEFTPFNLTEALNNLDIDLSAIWAAINQIRAQIAPILNRWQVFENVPEDAKIMLGNINLYSDYGAAVNSAGVATSLDKSHGIYGHSLNIDKSYDELFG